MKRLHFRDDFHLAGPLDVAVCHHLRVDQAKAAVFVAVFVDDALQHVH